MHIYKLVQTMCIWEQWETPHIKPSFLAFEGFHILYLWAEQTFRLFIFFYHGYLEEEKSMIHSFTVTFRAKYLTGMFTSVPPYETFSLIEKIFFVKIYKNHFENSNFWGMWPLGHVGHVTYSFINMLFISTGIFDDKLCPQILSVGTTTISPLSMAKVTGNYYFNLSMTREPGNYFLNLSMTREPGNYFLNLSMTRVAEHYHFN